MRRGNERGKGESERRIEEGEERRKGREKRGKKEE